MNIARFISPVTDENSSNILLLEIEFGEVIRIDSSCEITNAIRLMFMHKIAMLPVYEGDELVGVVYMNNLPSN